MGGQCLLRRDELASARDVQIVGDTGGRSLRSALARTGRRRQRRVELHVVGGRWVGTRGSRATIAGACEAEASLNAADKCRNRVAGTWLVGRSACIRAIGGGRRNVPNSFA